MCLDGGRGKGVEGKGVWGLWAVWLYTFSCLDFFFFFRGGGMDLSGFEGVSNL